MTHTTSISKSDQINTQNRLDDLGNRFPNPGVIRVGLLGLGTVGQGLCRLLQENGPASTRASNLDFQITTVLMRHTSNSRSVVPPKAELIQDPELFLNKKYDLVVECIGGVEPAGRLISAFLKQGVPVVTANKALMAERGAVLLALAAKNKTTLRYEASVAAGIPILSLCGFALHSLKVTQVSAILNGTSNFILNSMDQESATLSHALKKAQDQGFAEADPHLDLSGMDSAQKLSILVNTLGNKLDLDDIKITGLTKIEPIDCSIARTFGFALKHVAFSCLAAPKAWGFVAPALVPEKHPLAGVLGVDNGIHLCGDPLGTLFLSGPGAGGLPTAASLLDDMISTATGFPAPHLATYRKENTVGNKPSCFESEDNAGKQKNRSLSSWYLSLTPKGAPDQTDDLLDYLAASGTIFRELRIFNEHSDRTIAGVTTPIPDLQIQKLESRLNSSDLLNRFRAFRVIEATLEEDLK